MKPRVFFYVQHLLGIGHVIRALRIARAIDAGGFFVELVVGGGPVGFDTSGLSVVQLTPLRASSQGFNVLVTMEGQAADESLKAARCEELLAAFRRSTPDILLIEAFPFGRRQMRFELLPLLEAAHAMRPRPVIVSSIRDILQEGQKPGRNEETVGTLQRYFDRVIVHGDGAIVPLGETFPLADRISHMTSYSGMVGPEATGGTAVSEPFDVIVSAGGGAVGRQLLEAAVEAKPRTVLGAARWLAITGPNALAEDVERLSRLAAGADVTMRRFVDDLAQRLGACTLSVSQAGYNTVADILRAGCRSVLVPFAAGGETEQTRRAELLAASGLAVIATEADLTAASLGGAIDRAMGLAAPRTRPILDGAARTADILADLLRQRSGGAAR